MQAKMPWVRSSRNASIQHTEPLGRFRSRDQQGDRANRLRLLKTNDCIWVVGVAVCASLYLPNYIARELFAALLLFSVLFLAAAILLSMGVMLWHMGRRFSASGVVRNYIMAVRRFTTHLWLKTHAG